MTEDRKIEKIKEGMGDTVEVTRIIRSVETDATSMALHAATIAYAKGLRDGARIAGSSMAV